MNGNSNFSIIWSFEYSRWYSFTCRGQKFFPLFKWSRTLQESKCFQCRRGNFTDGFYIRESVMQGLDDKRKIYKLQKWEISCMDINGRLTSRSTPHFAAAHTSSNSMTFLFRPFQPDKSWIWLWYYHNR